MHPVGFEIDFGALVLVFFLLDFDNQLDIDSLLLWSASSILQIAKAEFMQTLFTPVTWNSLPDKLIFLFDFIAFEYLSSSHLRMYSLLNPLPFVVF